MSALIEVGACYRDPSDGEVVRVIGRGGTRVLWECMVLASGRGSSRAVGEVVWRSHDELDERVPDPTPAVIDDTLEAAEEMARQERIDATARAIFVARASWDDELSTAESDGVYVLAESLEAARERYIATRKGGAK